MGVRLTLCTFPRRPCICSRLTRRRRWIGTGWRLVIAVAIAGIRPGWLRILRRRSLRTGRGLGAVPGERGALTRDAPAGCFSGPGLFRAPPVGCVVTVLIEQVLVADDLSISRIHGPARDPIDGTHRSVVVLARSVVSDRELARLLHDAASRIERTLPRVEA